MINLIPSLTLTSTFSDTGSKMSLYSIVASNVNSPPRLGMWLQVKYNTQKDEENKRESNNIS